MSTASLTALVTAITGLVAAAATLAGVIRHVTGPAHKGALITGAPASAADPPPPDPDPKAPPAAPPAN